MKRSKSRKSLSIANGTSTETMLRDRKTGQWIMRINKNAEPSEAGIPSTFVVVENNIVNYIDIERFLSEISGQRKRDSLKGLEYLYSEILDSFDNYRAYSNGIEKVFDYCEKNSPRFEAMVKGLCDEIEPTKPKTEIITNLKEIASALVKILLIYLYAAVIKNKERVRSEKVIIGRIHSLYETIQRLLEQTAIPSHKYNKELLDYNASIYPAFFFGNLNYLYVERLVRLDSRFCSSLEALQSATKHLTVTQRGTYDRKAEIRGEFYNFSSNDERVKLLDMLVELLEDINRLKKIRAEISAIDNDEILQKLESYTHNPSM